MTLSIRDIAYQLRQGQLIAIADETGWSIAADPVHDAAVGQLMTLLTTMPRDLQPTVVIHNADQLSLYVAKVPDVAYDLVEFAENPLTVIYDQGKNLSAVFWQVLAKSPEGSDSAQVKEEIAVRRVLNADLQRLISSFGRGLLTIPFESLLLPPAAEALITIRFGPLPGMPKRPRIMRLKVNGEINFIRK